MNLFDDMTDKQLVDLEQSLYEDEVHGDGDWFQRDRVLWEMNRRGLMNHPHIGEFRNPPGGLCFGGVFHDKPA